MINKAFKLWVIFSFLFVSLGTAGHSAEKRGIALGQVAPNISGKDLKGNTYSLDSLRGSFALIVFWAVDCPACAVELPKFQSFYKKQAGKDFKMLSFVIDTRPKEPDIENVVKERGYTFPVVSFPSSEWYRLVEVWRFHQTPASYFINPEGVILLKGFMADEGTSLMKRIMQKNRSFIPPKVDFSPKGSPLGEVVMCQAIFPDYSVGTYDLIIAVQSRYVKESGELGVNETLIPLKVSITKDKSGKVRVDAKVEKKSVTGISAKIPNPSAIQIIKKNVGRTLLVEVIVPAYGTQSQSVAVANIYSRDLKSYVPIGGGFPVVQ